NLADLWAGLAILAALEDFELARRERGVRQLLALRVHDRALERMLRIDADDLQRGPGALAEVRLTATWAEQRDRTGQRHHRDDDPIPGVEFPPLVDDRLLGLAQITARADVAPRVGIERMAKFRHHGIAFEVVLLDVVVDPVLRPIIHQDARIAAG